MKVNPQYWCCKFSKTLESHKAAAQLVLEPQVTEDLKQH